ncbi:MAG TPA: hypothetical protein VHT91_09820 [Kofleriaceae bacterium]|nr:hypothetical protein [Kofleriaceae bacterium]
MSRPPVIAGLVSVATLTSAAAVHRDHRLRAGHVRRFQPDHATRTTTTAAATTVDEAAVATAAAGDQDRAAAEIDAVGRDDVERSAAPASVAAVQRVAKPATSAGAATSWSGRHRARVAGGAAEGEDAVGIAIAARPPEAPYPAPPPPAPPPPPGSESTVSPSGPGGVAHAGSAPAPPTPASIDASAPSTMLPLATIASGRAPIARSVAPAANRRSWARIASISPALVSSIMRATGIVSPPARSSWVVVLYATAPDSSRSPASVSWQVSNCDANVTQSSQIPRAPQVIAPGHSPPGAHRVSR